MVLGCLARQDCNSSLLHLLCVGLLLLAFSTSSISKLRTYRAWLGSLQPIFGSSAAFLAPTVILAEVGLVLATLLLPMDQLFWCVWSFIGGASVYLSVQLIHLRLIDCGCWGTRHKDTAEEGAVSAIRQPIWLAARNSAVVTVAALPAMPPSSIMRSLLIMFPALAISAGLLASILMIRRRLAIRDSRGISTRLPNSDLTYVRR